MVCNITYFPFLVVVAADNTVPDLAALLATGKANPEQLSYGTAGIGSTHHLAGELLASLSKTPLLHIPYKGDSASVTALLSGDIPMIIAPATVAEQGVSAYDVRSWAGLMAPAGTPQAVIDRLNAEVLKALQVPAVRSRLEEMGGEARGSTPDEMKSLVTRESDKCLRVVSQANIAKQ